MKRLILAFLGSVSAFAAAAAGPADIKVEHAWARAMPKGAATAAAYITLINSAGSEDRLLGVSSPVAKKVELHSMTNDNGVMKMEALPTLDIHPGSTVALKPGGIHMMMTGLKQQLKEGQTFPFTLTFEKAGSVTATARVGKIGAMDDPDAHAGNGG